MSTAGHLSSTVASPQIWKDEERSSLSLGGPEPFVPLLVLVEVLLADTGLDLPQGGHEVLVVDGPGHGAQ